MYQSANTAQKHFEAYKQLTDLVVFWEMFIFIWVGVGGFGSILPPLIAQQLLQGTAFLNFLPGWAELTLGIAMFLALYVGITVWATMQHGKASAQRAEVFKLWLNI